jgi:hypothetical protein
MIYRLWSDGEDMGTAGEHAARLWLTIAKAKGEDARMEPVEDDAPVFLDQPEKTRPPLRAYGERRGPGWRARSRPDCRQ